MLWLKAFHIIFMVTWFAGLFYLPRLYVYHAMADDPAGIARFKVMERKLFYGIMTPGAVLTLVPASGCGSVTASAAAGCTPRSLSSRSWWSITPTAAN